LASPWLKELRARGAELAGRLAWPTTQEEEWRRTSLTGLKLERWPGRGQGRKEWGTAAPSRSFPLGKQAL
jgi:hypothetical protein